MTCKRILTRGVQDIDGTLYQIASDLGARVNSISALPYCYNPKTMIFQNFGNVTLFISMTVYDRLTIDRQTVQ